MQEKRAEVSKVYTGARDKWAIGRFVDGKKLGPYYIGVLISGGISFHTEKNFTSREDAEGWLVYHIDGSVKL